MRETPNGQSVVTFGLATNREWVTKDGRKQSSVEYHDLVAWAKLAEICNQYLKRGKLVYVEGYLKTRNWETPEGIKKFRTEIVVQDMIMLDKRGGDEDGEYMIQGNENYEDQSSNATESTSPGQKETEPATSAAETTPEETSTVSESQSTNSSEEEKKKEPAAVATEKNGNIDIDSDLGL